MLRSKETIRKISTIVRENLDSCTMKNTPIFCLNNVITKCKVLDVDNNPYICYNKITIAVPFSFSIYKFRLQVIDVNKITLENKLVLEHNYNKNNNFLHNLLCNKLLYIKCGKWNKNGDLTGDIFFTLCDMETNNSINKLIIS